MVLYMVYVYFFFRKHRVNQGDNTIFQRGDDLIRPKSNTLPHYGSVRKPNGIIAIG